MLTALVLLAALDSAPAKPGQLAALGPIPKDTVRAFLVRHGQALSNLNPRPKLTPKELDHLTDLGRAQTARTRALLHGQGVRLVLTSPAERARETAAILADTVSAGVPPVEPRLRSMELGRSPAGQPLGWTEREVELKAGRDPQPPGGESFQQVADRMIDLLTTLARERGGQGVVLVSHSEVISALVGSVRGLPKTEWEELGIPNASVTVVDATPGKPPRVLLVGLSAEGAKP
ncbi:MAG TPA: histidine phosphatase family protein [Vicinamibacteria bacterium]